MRHGESGYSAGCRCEECKKGHREWAKKYRDANKDRINAQRRAKQLTDEQKARRREQQRAYEQRRKERDPTYKQYRSEIGKRSYKKHAAKRRKASRDWKFKNPEGYELRKRRSIEARKKQRAEEWEALRAKEREWSRKYRQTEKGILQKRWDAASYNWRKRGAAGRATKQQVEWRKAYYGYRCWNCKAPATTVDHKIPLSRGGSNWPSNLRPACVSCNAKKVQ